MEINVKDNMKNIEGGAQAEHVDGGVTTLPYKPQKMTEETYNSTYFQKRTNRTDESYRRLKAVREILESFPRAIESAGTHTASNELMKQYDKVIEMLEIIEQAELEIITMDE